jgi:hypothetical protein
LTGFGDCDGQEGCETPLDTPDNCGACRNRCQDSHLCSPARRCECAKLTCGDLCVDPQTSDQHCGRCDHPCPVGCNNGVCRCPTPSPANLIRNGGLDRDTGTWRAYSSMGPTLSWKPEDAADCSGSGSMVVHNTAAQRNISQSALQCIRVVPGTSYDFGGWMKETPAAMAPDAALLLDWFASTDCSDTYFDQVQTDYLQGRKVWTHLGGKGTAPARARSAGLIVYVAGGGSEVAVDMLYVAPTPGRF